MTRLLSRRYGALTHKRVAVRGEESGNARGFGNIRHAVQRPHVRSGEGAGPHFQLPEQTLHSFDLGEVEF